MRLSSLASFVHKWLALIVGAQILLWVASGLFFTLYPIAQVRSEHRVRELAPVSLAAADFARVSALAGALGAAKVTLEARREGPVILAEFRGGRPQLFDARTGARLSPLSQNAALSVARAGANIDAPVRETRWVAAEAPEYRGALPAWRIEFDEPQHLAVYVAADTGRITAWRSDLWRVYDALWALHIMDWRDHENFNHGLIIAASILALVSTIAGILLIPYRFRWRRRALPKA